MTSRTCWPELVVVLGALAACYGGAGADGDGGTADDDSATDVVPTDDAGEAPGDDDGSATMGDDAADDDGPPTCAAPEVACGQICADMATDPNNCGDCGVSCVIPDAGAACSAGTCTIDACDVGFADCD